MKLGLRNYGVAGQIGLEPSIDAFLDVLCRVYDEVWRVLRDDGVCWINLGDSFANGNSGERVRDSNGGFQPGLDTRTQAATKANPGFRPMKANPSLKPGDLMLIPHRIALALQARGWTVRQDNCWHKLSPMPESISGTRWEQHRIKVKGVGNEAEGWQRTPRTYDPAIGGQRYQGAEWADCPGCERCTPNGGLVLRRGSWRTTRAHEYLFQLTKGQGYYADGEAVRTEAARPGDIQTFGGEKGRNYDPLPGDPNFRSGSHQAGRTVQTGLNGANARSVLTFKSEPLKLPHYAAFPPSLPTWCIRCSTSEAGVCPHCGAQWARVVEREQLKRERPNEYTKRQPDMDGIGNTCANDVAGVSTTTLSWRPTCSCPEHTPIPALVLDPFSGAGTTVLAARRLGRRGLGVELNPEYAEMSRQRISEDNPLFNGGNP